MKRFLLFHGVIYYPGRGGEDFLSVHDTLEEAKETGATKIKKEGPGNWANIFDNELYSVASELVWDFSGDDAEWEDLPLDA